MGNEVGKRMRSPNLWSNADVYDVGHLQTTHFPFLPYRKTFSTRLKNCSSRFGLCGDDFAVAREVACRLEVEDWIVCLHVIFVYARRRCEQTAGRCPKQQH